jgi:hypothetical protein
VGAAPVVVPAGAYRGVVQGRTPDRMPETHVKTVLPLPGAATPWRYRGSSTERAKGESGIRVRGRKMPSARDARPEALARFNALRRFTRGPETGGLPRSGGEIPPPPRQGVKGIGD